MGDADLAKCIKQTQDTLGKYVKKPPLSDKNLSRPPFRFLHDITTTVISTTGFLNGVFGSEELDSNNLTTREGKTEFMRKLVAAVNEATGEDVPVKVSKILAGQEPENTNLLLQSLAKAIEKSQGGGSETKKAGKSTAPTSKPKQTTSSELKKSVPEKKSDPKIAQKTEPKATAPKKTASSTSNLPNKTSSTKTNEQGKVKKAETPSTKTSTGAKEKDRDRSGERRPSNTDLKKGKGDGKDKKELPSAGGNKGSGDVLKRQETSLTKVEKSESLENGNKDAEVMRQSGGGDGTELGMSNDPNTLEPIIPNNIGDSMFPDPSLLGFSSSNVPEIPDDTNIEDASSPFSPSVEQKDSGRNDSAYTKIKDAPSEPLKSDVQDGPPVSWNRPGTASNRFASARPPSARPAPPRPRSSMFRDSEESMANYRPPTGKVTNVLLDNSDADDDDHFVVREAAVPSTHSLGDVDETPELALPGSKFDTEASLEDLAPEDRGLLVNQILETQRELEGSDASGRKDDAGPTKSKETSKAEVEKLKNLLQECARNANPLGKLLDYVREDIDAMQREVTKWREESKALDAELENVRKATEVSLQPLQQQLHEVETQVADKEDGIAATNMSILRLQERVEKILSGLDRVQSSHGKIDIPSANQLLQRQPSITSNKSWEREDNYNSRQGSANSIGISSGFGATLNRLAQTTPGMRPINMFSTSTEDLDPDNFDPFK